MQNDTIISLLFARFDYIIILFGRKFSIHCIFILFYFKLERENYSLNVLITRIEILKWFKKFGTVDGFVKAISNYFK